MRRLAPLLCVTAVLMLVAARTCLSAKESVVFPPVKPGVALQFPRDHGAHPTYRTEWWYITGWVKTDRGEDLGVQVTFFRYRPGTQEDNPSAFAPHQIIIAHAALADPAHGKLMHDQRAARVGFEQAWARENDTDVAVDRWRLWRQGDNFSARIRAEQFSLSLNFSPTQAIMQQGQGGFSRKGPRPEQASYYYSWPHLRVSGTVMRAGQSQKVTGSAWMDHEWSSEYLPSGAVGWDWVGLNLADGGALMLFRMRDRDGKTFWASGTRRDAQGKLEVLQGTDIAFTPRRHWRSARTGVQYPVTMQVRAGALSLELIPLLDDQELNARYSTGTVYWEGAVRAYRDGAAVGQGYLELTGYGQQARF